MDAFFDLLKIKLGQKSERVGGQGGDCIIWKGAVSRFGYGVMKVTWPEEGRKQEKVHRVALMVEMHLTRSQFPGEGLEVSHLCHKKLCVNPVHLVIEPHATNLERRHCFQQGVCCGTHLPQCIV